jgi:quinol monooxygenase YgiN
VSDLISVVATFIPKEGQEGAVESTLRGMVGPTRAEPGCKRYDLYRSAGSDTKFILIEAYDGQSALEAHRATEHYKSYRSRIADMLQDPIGVVVLNAVDAKN